ncbi:hypothetical protein NDI52_14370 [Leptolyngbya sp. PL-A3]|uniref:hypothetical protein n=1 Tax=Leptolyngbya sp. PL-A3 TaxID=2933911 RepID=UPI003299F09A
MERHQITIFEALQEPAHAAEPVATTRLTQLPAAVLPPQPEPPPLPPVPPLKKGQQVVVSDPAGDWIGVVQYDDGELVDILRGKSTTAISYPRNQVRLLPARGTLTTDPKLLEDERSRRETQRRNHPWVDCFRCIHHYPVDAEVYGCHKLPFTPRRSAPYGTHIGCNKFVEATHGETPNT